MHDDNEERFPRISLWQFLVGVFWFLCAVDLWKPNFDPGPGETRKPDHTNSSPAARSGQRGTRK
jgi:hypothetical protein